MYEKEIFWNQQSGTNLRGGKDHDNIRASFNLYDVAQASLYLFMRIALFLLSLLYASQSSKTGTVPRNIPRLRLMDQTAREDTHHAIASPNTWTHTRAVSLSYRDQNECCPWS